MRVYNAKILVDENRKIVEIHVFDEEAYSELIEALSRLNEFTTSCEPNEHEQACSMLEIDDYIVSISLIRKENVRVKVRDRRVDMSKYVYELSVVEPKSLQGIELKYGKDARIWCKEIFMNYCDDIPIGFDEALKKLKEVIAQRLGVEADRIEIEIVE